MTRTSFFGQLCLLLLLSQAAHASPATPVVAAAVQNKRIFEMKPAEVHQYLADLQRTEPELRKRVAAVARRNIGQPYKLFLLGEFPFQITDPQPMFDLTHSDCLVFAEHTYAMAMSGSWDEFFWVLQRIRYRDGVIGVVTRNHYTEADWNPANAWLVADMTAELAGTRVANYTMTADRNELLRSRYQLSPGIPPQQVMETYVPKEMVAELESKLKEGDMVNVVSGRKGEKLVSHVGMVVIGPGGKRHMIHSAEPMVREETFAAFIQRADERAARSQAQGKEPLRLYGFKFLRLAEDPVVPPMKPQPRPGRR